MNFARIRSLLWAGAVVGLTMSIVSCSGDDQADTPDASETTASTSAVSSSSTTEAPAAIVRCDEGSGGAGTTTTVASDASTTDAPTTDAPTTDAPTVSAGEGDASTTGPPTTEAPEGCDYQIDWSALVNPTLFTFDDTTNPDDPFWHLHNHPDDGFFLSLEMYTTGYGSAWTGETGTFDLACTELGSGICIHFDPDGDGHDHTDLNLDFAATGTIEITTLDLDEGYDVTISEVVFSDGSTITGPVHLVGEATDMDTVTTDPPSTDDLTTSTDA